LTHGRAVGAAEEDTMDGLTGSAIGVAPGRALTLGLALFLVAVLMAWPLWVGLARRPRLTRLGATLTAVTAAIWFGGIFVSDRLDQPVGGPIGVAGIICAYAFEAWAVWRVVRARRRDVAAR
jgi:hypothetical protein